jgi:hypothetical protein
VTTSIASLAGSTAACRSPTQWPFAAFRVHPGETGWQVDVAASGRGGLKLLQIALHGAGDIHRPGMNGLQLLRGAQAGPDLCFCS